MKRWALISVSNKDGVVEFARGLQEFGVGIISTGGTAKTLFAAGLSLTTVEQYTKWPEMMDGRLKTLHPLVHGGILGRREDSALMERHGIVPVDFVVVNLYPFIETVAQPDCTFEKAIENIDIGGPTMLRAAAKNHARVAPICDPSDYDALLTEMKANRGALSLSTRKKLSYKTFAHTADYDAAITAYLATTA